MENKKLTFHKHVSGYVLSSNSSLFIHQIVTSCHGNGKGTKNISVDHIDRNNHNNNIENLRWCTRLTNARNKATYKDNLTPEQLEARKARTRERSRIWARKQREAKKLTIV
jgi:hypothetical protein